MGYVEKTLGRGEAIVHRANFNWTYSFMPVFWFALGAAPVVMYAMLHFQRGYSFEELRSGWYFALAGLSAGSIILGLHLIRLWTTEIIVTSYRFVFKVGLVARNTQEVSLNKIEEITLHQSVLGRLFGYGKLVIRGTGVGVIELPALDDPIRVRKLIESARADLRRVDHDERTGEND
jgi:hypothetical protein